MNINYLIYFIKDLKTNKILFFNKIQNYNLLFIDINQTCPFQYNQYDYKISLFPFSISSDNIQRELNSLYKIYGTPIYKIQNVDPNKGTIIKIIPKVIKL